MRFVGYVACMQDTCKPYKVLKGKLQNKRAVERPRNRWEGDL
jgi:hypothetical protein